MSVGWCALYLSSIVYRITGAFLITFFSIVPLWGRLEADRHLIPTFVRFVRCCCCCCNSKIAWLTVLFDGNLKTVLVAGIRVFISLYYNISSVPLMMMMMMMIIMVVNLLLLLFFLLCEMRSLLFGIPNVFRFRLHQLKLPFKIVTFTYFSFYYFSTFPFYGNTSHLLHQEWE